MTTFLCLQFGCRHFDGWKFGYGQNNVAQRFYYNEIGLRCPGGKAVLGCGFKPDLLKGPEGLRTMKMDASNGCTCYDWYGTTCYAICGELIAGGKGGLIWQVL
jgi:hypothetical protein